MNKLLVLFVIVFFSCQAKDGKHQQQAAAFRASVFRSEFGGFGFDIYANDKLIIHQPTVPVLRGQKGFPSEVSATSAAQLMIEKILSNQMPPSLSESEVNSLL